MSEIQREIAAALEVLPKIATAAMVLLVIWGLATLVRRIARAGAEYTIRDRTRRLLVTQVSYYVVWAAGFIVMLDVVGVNLNSAVTALGLGGVAVGFALKDILSNLVKAVCSFSSCAPSRSMIKSRQSPPRAASVGVRIPRLQGGCGARPLSHSRGCQVGAWGGQRPAPSMRLRDLSQERLQLEARFWADSRRTNLMNTASAARVAILSALKEAGIQLPDPDQRLVTMTPAPGRATSAETSEEVTYGRP